MNPRLFRYVGALFICAPLSASGGGVQDRCWGRSAPVCDDKTCFDVGTAWAGDPVTFAIATRGSYQVVAYYNEQRQLVVAERSVGMPFKRRIVLPTVVNWDSHNGIAMAFDQAGYIHIAANMHASPMNYFVSAAPESVSTIARVSIAAGSFGASVTYPQFFTDASGKLHMLFRFGKSGSGGYALLTHISGGSWSLPGGKPLLAFGASASPYISGPYKDANGKYHLGWIIRDTRDASTNHDIFYAQSTDLVNWTDSHGRPLGLPIQAGQGELAAPVAKGMGLLNGNVKMGFDRNGRPTFLFSKIDQTGDLGIYSSRLEHGAWTVRKSLDLGFKWSINGGGSIENQLNIYSPELGKDGVFRASIVIKNKQMSCVVRPVDTDLVGCIAGGSDVPPVLMHSVSTFPGMRVRMNSVNYSGRHYLLRWETLPADRDKAAATVPPPSKLQLFDLDEWSKCK